MNNKKGAMEMSMGTIVTIVLLMSVLILGLVFVKDIFNTSKGAIGVLDDNLLSEVNKIYGDVSKIGIYPTNKQQKIKQEDTDEIGVVITNLLKGSEESKDFSYQVSLKDAGDCKVSEDRLMGLIILGEEGSDIILLPGEQSVERIRFGIPAGFPFCNVRYGVKVYVGTEPYASTDFDIEITK